MSTLPVYYHIAYYLASNGFGTLGNDIFGGEWGEPSKQVLVLNGVGTPVDIKELYEAPAVQIIVRGGKSEADIEVYQRAKAISDFLLAAPEQVDIQGVCYTGFEEATTLANLGKDEKQRFIYSMNFSTFRNRN